MNVKPRLRVVQRFQCKINAAFQHFRRLWQKIVVGRIPQHTDPVRLRQRAVIELDLHVEHVGHTGLRQFFHVPRVPDPTAQRNSFRDPGHVHAAFRSPSRRNPQSAFYDYSDSTSPFPSPWLAGNSSHNPSFSMSDFATDSCSSIPAAPDAGNIPAISQRKRNAKTLPRSFTDRTTRLVISTDACTITFVTRFRAFWSSSGFLGTAVTPCGSFGFRDLDLLFFAFAICPPEIEKGRDLRRVLQSFYFFLDS